MKNCSLCIFTLLLLSFLSCKKEETIKPKVIYDDASKSKKEAQVDTTTIAVADLPVHLEGTNVLIYPIGTINKTKRFSYNESSYTISNYGEYQITGYLKNLKFQEFGKDTLVALTDKPILIDTATYLKTLADKSKLQLMVYTMVDSDTNKDGKLDSNDIKSLYISTVTGQNLSKLTADFQELIDWKVIETKNQLYFRTKEDTNKNGQFENTDVIRCFLVNLLDKNLETKEYFPI